MIEIIKIWICINMYSLAINIALTKQKNNVKLKSRSVCSFTYFCILSRHLFLCLLSSVEKMLA